MNDTTIGFLAVVGAVLFFGSFAVPLKTKRVQDANVEPLVFQLYYSFSIFLSSWLVLSYVPFVFTPLGIVGASLWVPASILSIRAITHLGMSIAVGVWAGTTVIVSFLWGSVVYHEDVKNIGLAVVGLLLLLIGIGGLSFSNTNYVKNYGRKQDLDPLLSDRLDINTENENQPQKRPFIGLVSAFTLGVLNGSMMVPLRYVPEEAKGINYIISFGIGVIIVTVVMLYIYWLIFEQLPPFHVKATMLPGMITGLLWNVGNYCSIYATLYLGLTVGFPLTQLALVVSGLWGIIAFKEIGGIRTLSVWAISVTVLLAGAALLALYG